MLIQLTGSRATVVKDEQRARPQGSEVERLVGSSARIAALTGWKPAVTLEQGLRETIEWFRSGSTLGRYKPDVYNV